MKEQIINLLEKYKNHSVSDVFSEIMSLNLSDQVKEFLLNAIDTRSLMVDGELHFRLRLLSNMDPSKSTLPKLGLILRAYNSPQYQKFIRHLLGAFMYSDGVSEFTGEEVCVLCKCNKSQLSSSRSTEKICLNCASSLLEVKPFIDKLDGR